MEKHLGNIRGGNVWETFGGEMFEKHLEGNFGREKLGENFWGMEGNVHSTRYNNFIGRVGIFTILCL